MTLCADLDEQPIRKEESSDLSVVCMKVASRHAITPVTEMLSVRLVEKLDLTCEKISIAKCGAPGSALDEIDRRYSYGWIVKKCVFFRDKLVDELWQD